MHFHLRSLALLVAAVSVVGVTLAVTVWNTDENKAAPDSGTTSIVTTTGPTAATGPTATTGPTAVTGETGSTADYAQALPLPINGPMLGVNLTAYTRDGYGDPEVQKMMRTIADLGSTTVTLVPTWYMKRPDSNRIRPDEEKTPSDESLIKAIDWARESGLQVVLKPHVDVIDDTYRGDIQPADRASWFRSYQRFTDHFASFASSYSADMYVVGTELKSMSVETDPWRQVIRDSRDLYAGPITYAANWDEVDQIQFWDDLDAIGVDAYYPLSGEGSQAPTLQSLTAAWLPVKDQLKARSSQWDRPVILTEIGYPSQIGATVKPFEVTGQPVDQNVQALAYRAAFKVFSGSGWLEGISWWSWRADPSAEENLESDYTPMGKKAQGELARGQFLFIG